MWGTTRTLVVLIAVFFSVAPGRANAISYTPTVSDVVLNPGESAEVTFEVYDSDRAASYRLSLVGVELGDTPEELAFTQVDPEVASWMTLTTPAFALQAGEVEHVTVSITVPETASARDQFVGVQVTQEGHTGAVEVREAAVHLVFLTIGDLPVALSVTDFSTSNSFYNRLPVPFSFMVENSGARTVQPSGSIKIRNIFGLPVETVPVNAQGSRSIPGTTRTFEAQWGPSVQEGDFFQELHNEIKAFGLGWFKAQLDLGNETGDDVGVQEATFFILPWRLMLSAVALAGVLYSLLRWSRRL